ncbi:MAG: AbrB/MazE/SpoVT family DNA-binding domain-containing protein [Terriglobales bacterium]
MKRYVQLSSKGQVVIPADIRERYGLDAGTRFAVEAGEDGIVLRPITDKYIENLRGYFREALR